jgi:hypothetical protein
LLQSKIRDWIIHFGQLRAFGAKRRVKHHSFAVLISVGGYNFLSKIRFRATRAPVGFDFNPDLRDQQRISACMHGIT